MKRVTTILLAFAIVISSIAIATNKANAETTEATVTETPAATIAPTVAPTEEPEEEEVKQRKKSMHVVSYGNVITGSMTGAKRAFYYSDGKTIEMTKGFTETIELCGYKKAVKWSTDDSTIIAVKAKAVDLGKKGKVKGCTVKAKTYGKATLIATYNGQVTTVTVKVVKNQFSCKIKDLPEFDVTTADSEMKKLGWECCGVTSAKYNKKGNLVLKCYEEYKPSKYGKIIKRRSLSYSNCASFIEISDGHAKVILKYKKKHGSGKSLSVQHPKYKETIVIPKKKLKGKKLDLRKVFYDYWRYGN